MFYSHELLRSNEGGVATVWILATLGPKSAAKKITRKQILGIDVPKACQKIRTPDVPIALRLQSNLLFGVSRAYVQQCDFVLTDAQQAHASLRALIKTARRSDIDMKTTKAQSQDLVLHDDPNFLPDLDFASLDLNMTLSKFSPAGSPFKSSFFSPHSQMSSVTSGHDEQEGSLALIIPRSISDAGSPFGAFSVPSEDYGSARRHARMRELLGEEDPMDLHSGFAVDDEGNLIAIDDSHELRQDPSEMSARASVHSDSADLALVRERIQAAQEQVPEEMHVDFDMGLPGIGDITVAPDTEEAPLLALDAPEVEQLSSEPSSESVRAPQQRKPRTKAFFSFDRRTQLPAAELNTWSNEYVENMRKAAQERHAHRAAWIAKANATVWTFGRGIGDIGQHPAMLAAEHPLAMFIGDNLRAALDLDTPPTESDKRKRSDDEGQRSSTDGRNVRARNESVELARGGTMAIDDDAGMLMTPEDVEYGRHAEAPLADISSQFPWSGMTSRQGSLVMNQGLISSAGGFASGAARRSSAMPAPFERRGSRLTSGSPLVGRSQHERYSSLELPLLEGREDLPVGGGSSIGGLDEDFQLYGPAAGVSTQTAGESQWIRSTLDGESNNFLEFVRTRIQEKDAGPGADELASETNQGGSITFEMLLPPTQHTKIVAAQALLHTLSLATKGLVNVRQEEGYGSIDLSLLGTL